MPGCGKKRGRDVVSLRLDDVVEELNQDLRVLRGNQAVLFGHSIAGAVLPRMEISQDATPRCFATASISREGYAGMIPASYILTQRDNILPVDWQRRFAQRAGAGEVIEIDTVHEPFVSHPQLLAEVVRGFEWAR